MVVEAMLPAALLQPVWQHNDKVTCEQQFHLNQTFDALSTGFAVCARLRCSECDQRRGRLIQHGAPQDGWALVASCERGGVVKFSFDIGGQEPQDAQGDVGDDRSFNVDDRWHHVAVSCSAGTVTLYLDGRLHAKAVMKAPPSRQHCLFVGPYADGAVPGLWLCEVQAYDHNLTSAQIADLASSRTELPTGISLPLLPGAVLNIWEFLGSSERPKALASIAKSLGWEDMDLDFAQKVKIDFYLDLLQFSLEICLTAGKAAVIVGIVECIFQAMHGRSQTTSCVGERYSVSECFVEYRRLLLAHSSVRQCAPDQVQLQVFSMPEAKQITDFMTQAFFSHFILYQSVLVCPQESTTVYVEAEVAYPRRPPDLAQARLAIEVSSRKAAAKASAVVAAGCRASNVNLASTELPPQPADEPLGDVSFVDEGESAKGLAACGSRGDTKDSIDERYDVTPDLDIHQHHSRVSARAVQSLRESVKSHANAVEGRMR